MSEKKDAKDDISEDELDQIIQDMSEDEEEAPEAPKPVAASEVAQVKKIASLPRPEKADQALTLELSGVVNLKLSFTNGERTIELFCSEEALVCRMADGTEFRVPTGTTKGRKAA